MSFERWLAALGLLACAVIGVRMLLPERWRWRLDARLRRAALLGRRFGLNAWHWRRRRHAASAADAAIRRARGEVAGKVVRPKSFKRPRGPQR